MKFKFWIENLYNNTKTRILVFYIKFFNKEDKEIREPIYK